MKKRSDVQVMLLIGAVSAVALALYLGWSASFGHLGFPLDDAWIHLTYARNLAQHGQWAFVLDQPSAGSTAPLWTLLLTAGFLPPLLPRLWTYLLGWLCLAGTGLLAGRLAQRLFPERRWAPLLAGLACTLEWHLVWAAGSGMETLLFALLTLAIWSRLLADPTRRPFLTGLLGGALILTRPEGVTVIGLAVLGTLLHTIPRGRWRQGLLSAVLMSAGVSLALAPYLALNLRLSGTPWPNTFYAKQAEYAVLRLQPLTARLVRISATPLIGPLVLLVPGLIWAMWRRRPRSPEQPPSGPRGWRWIGWLPLAWVGGTLVMYAVRLPVTYQHGRYLMPLIPTLLVYGVGGTLDLVRSASQPVLARVLARTLLIAAGLLFPSFWAIIGAPAYATDVAIIEGEMVTVAQWINDHTAPDALIAAHDIGAIGYFARRPLLDMAGLVSPEVIPFIRNETEILDWLAEQKADYLVTFPTWYPTLTADPRVEMVFQTDTEVTREKGEMNMAVYALHWQPTR
ncbi:MAG: hypothetical protein PVI59_08250 [Anaerolineae bacterium]